MPTKGDRSRTRLRKTVFRLTLCLFTIALAGCATRRAIMVNERGEELTCETRGYGFIATLAAISQQDDCVKEAEKRGYRLKEPSN